MADPRYSAGDARAVFSNTLASYGFSDIQINQLIPQVTQWQAIYTPAQIVSDLLPTTQVYQERFSANASRIKNGLPPLAPNAYLTMENNYRAILKDAKLPPGFYDNASDFASFISQDISPSELKFRADSAAQAVNNTDPYYKQSLQDLYGIDEGMMVAHMLDPERAMPLIEKQAKAVQMGAAAKRQGLSVSTAEAENLAMNNITGVSAEQGMATIAEMTPGLSALAQIGGDQYDQATAESEVFGGLASAKRKRQQLTQQEQDRFTGRSSVDSKSLASGLEGML